MTIHLRHLWRRLEVNKLSRCVRDLREHGESMRSGDTGRHQITQHHDQRDAGLSVVVGASQHVVIKVC